MTTKETPLTEEEELATLFPEPFPFKVGKLTLPLMPMDLAACMRDGFSTAGTPGTGLGAVRRLADAFSAWSQPGQGAIMWARIAGARPPGSVITERFSVAARKAGRGRSKSSPSAAGEHQDVLDLGLRDG